MINLTSYIDYEAVMNFGLGLMLLFALIALYYDLTYKPKVYDLVTLLNRRIYQPIGERFPEKVSTNFLPPILSQAAYNEKYSIENEAKAIIESLKDNKYKTPVGFEKENYTGAWVHAEFQKIGKTDMPKKVVKPPYRVIPVQRLSMEESRKISVGSVELEKVYAEDNSK